MGHNTNSANRIHLTEAEKAEFVEMAVRARAEARRSKRQGDEYQDNQKCPHCLSWLVKTDIPVRTQGAFCFWQDVYICMNSLCPFLKETGWNYRYRVVIPGQVSSLTKEGMAKVEEAMRRSGNSG